MSPARQTVSTMTTNDMSLAAHHLPRKKVRDICADFDNLTHKLMAHNHRHGNGFLRPIVPLVNMQVSAADSCSIDPNQDIVLPDLRFGYVFQPQPGFRFP